MTSYNKVDKIKYEKNVLDPVTFEEYIIFTDDANEEKTIIFKFLNNLDQKLYNIQFEVSQYDEADGLIEKTLVAYDNFHANEHEEFVPKAKLKLDYKCVRISEKLVYAKFERIIFDKGEYTSYTTTFEQERKQRQLDAIDKKLKESKRQINKQRKEFEDASKTDYFKVEDISVPKLKDNFKLVDVYKQNSTSKPKVFNIFAAIVVLGLSIFAISFYKSSTATFSVGKFDYQFVSYNSCQIVGFDMETENISIPSKLASGTDFYYVEEIEKNTFKNANIKSVVINGETKIISHAFENCSQLKSVEGKATVVMSYAFSNCKKLETVELSNAYLLENCFYNCGHLQSLSFADTDCARFIDLYNSKASDSLVWVDYIETNMDKVPEGFFDTVVFKQVKFTNPKVTFDKETDKNNKYFVFN